MSGPRLLSDGDTPKPLMLTEDEVHARLRAREVTDWVENAFGQIDGGSAVLPRGRVRFSGGALHVLGGAVASYRLVAAKLYTTLFRPDGERRSSMLVTFDTDTGKCVAIIESYWLSIMRTAATTALATRYLAKPTAETLTVIGTGPTALPQIEAVAAERPFKRILIHSRTPAHREAFAEEVSRRLPVPAEAIADIGSAISAADVVITATDSREPFVHADQLRSGALVNAIGSNYADKRELAPDAIRRAERIFVDSIDAARVEAGDLILAAAEGALDWNRVEQLGSLVHQGRHSNADHSWFVFKSVGIGIQDIAVAAGLLGRIEGRRG